MLFFFPGAAAGGIEDLKTHDFFSTINWKKLVAREVQPPFKPVVNRVDDAFYFDTEFTSRTPKGISSKMFCFLKVFLGTLNLINSRRGKALFSYSHMPWAWLAS